MQFKKPLIGQPKPLVFKTNQTPAPKPPAFKPPSPQKATTVVEDEESVDKEQPQKITIFTARTIPNELRANYVSYVKATAAEQHLNELCTYLMDQAGDSDMLREMIVVAHQNVKGYINAKSHTLFGS